MSKENKFEIADLDDSTDNTDHLFCPITLQLMKNPHIAADGNTYEKEAIEKWFKTNSTSPKTGEEMPHKHLIFNRALKDAIDVYIKMHPANSRHKSSIPSPNVSSSSFGLNAQFPSAGFNSQTSSSSSSFSTVSQVFSSSPCIPVSSQASSFEHVLPIYLDDELLGYKAFERITSARFVKNFYYLVCKTLWRYLPASNLKGRDSLDMFNENEMREALREIFKVSGIFEQAKQEMMLAHELCNKEGVQNLPMQDNPFFGNRFGFTKEGIKVMFSYSIPEGTPVVVGDKGVERGAKIKSTRLSQTKIRYMDELRESLFADIAVSSSANNRSHAVSSLFAKIVPPPFLHPNVSPVSHFSSSSRVVSSMFPLEQKVNPSSASAMSAVSSFSSSSRVSSSILPLGPKADPSSAFAQYSLAVHYLRNKKDAPQNEAEGMRLLRLASGQGYANAQYVLGYSYFKGQGIAQNKMEGLRLLRLAIEQGHATAQHFLGLHYLYGRDVDKNEAEGLRLLGFAIEQGDSVAEYNLGCCYIDGRVIAKNEAEGIRLLRLAVQKNYLPAKKKLDSLGVSDVAISVPSAADFPLIEQRQVVFSSLPRANSLPGAMQYSLALTYFKGQGIYKNEAEGLRLLRLASDQGYAPAQSSLGLRYLDGNGVGKDEAEAVRLFRLGVDQGNKLAQYYLGLCYFEGIGVERNYVEGIRLHRLVIEQGGDIDAEYNLGVCYLNGEGVEKDEVEAVRLFKLGVDQNVKDAQYALGTCYLEGKGVAKNEKEGVRLIELAAAQGHPLARGKLDSLVKAAVNDNASNSGSGSGVIDDVLPPMPHAPSASSSNFNSSAGMVGSSNFFAPSAPPAPFVLASSAPPSLDLALFGGSPLSSPVPDLHNADSCNNSRGLGKRALEEGSAEVGSIAKEQRR